MKKEKSIRSKIFEGYSLIILMIIAQTVVSCLCLALISLDYKAVTRNRDNQILTQEAISGHYEWLNKLSISLQTGEEFTGSLDSSSCSLGEWVSSVSPSDLKDSAISSALNATTEPHQSIHTLAGEVLELSKTDEAGAFQIYSQKIKPQTESIIKNLQSINDRYKDMAQTASARLFSLIVISLVVNALVAVLAICFSFLCSRILSKRISNPITAVAEWSKKLSMGSQDLDFSSLDKDSAGITEIRNMVEAFGIMAESVAENVNVVKRVADGDMTVYVNIRSKEDSLGKNLYRMVQSNDLLFAEILDVASHVAQNADQISQLSQSLAESATTQAGDVSDLSSIIAGAGELSKENAQNAREAANLSVEASRNASESTKQMEHLSRSSAEIQDASQKVSAVIKTIEDIAFQTNILALNASVEAARAGAAGKGFAVVANEVRELANKSAQAATETRNLIENTINKTQEGSRISSLTLQTFHNMITEIGKIKDIASRVSETSETQLSSIEQINNEIREITDLAANNAAISEESAASSIEMNKYADMLKQSMDKFNLRKREEGRAYIPPEKQNDPEFIRIANENYQKAMATRLNDSPPPAYLHRGRNEQISDSRSRDTPYFKKGHSGKKTECLFLFK